MYATDGLLPSLRDRGYNNNIIMYTTYLEVWLELSYGGEMRHVLDMRAGVMSSKRKTSAPTRVLADVDGCQSDRDVASPTSVAPVDDDRDSDQSHPPSLRVVTSPSSLSADDDDVTDDVTASSSSGVVGGPAVDVSAPQRQWLSAEVTWVLNKIHAVVEAAGTVDEKRRRVDEMLTELEAIRRHLLTVTAAQSDTAGLSLCIVSVT